MFPGFKKKTRLSIEKLVPHVNIPPNTITIFSFILAIIATFIFFFFNRSLSFLLFILSFIFDSLDGAIARKMKKVTKFGAYLDSVIDKFVEGLIFFCFAFYNWPLAFLAGIFSILISYSKHRGDEFGIKIKGGFFERAERIGFVLFSGIFLEFFNLQQFIPHILCLTFALSTLTIIQRINMARNLL